MRPGRPLVRACTHMDKQDGRSRLSKRSAGSSSQFFRLVLPGLASVNLLLGAGLLIHAAHPVIWETSAEVATGVFCCAIAGWLGSAGWSKAYWGRTMERQVSYWRHLADILFRWLEDAPIPIEHLVRLEGSLSEAERDS